MPEKENRIYRMMPHNAEAESALLGSILIDNRTADQLIPTLKADDFYEVANRIVFSAMRALMDDSSVVDTVSVADRLMLLGKLDEAGGIDYLTSLAESIPSAAGAEHYADIVKRDSLIRRVISAGNNIAKKGYESVSGTDALLNAEKEIYSISEDLTEKDLVHASTALGAAMKEIQEVQAGIVNNDAVYTDFPSLDRMTHGLKPGELILVAARPSVGKTAFALNIAANACLKHNKTVAIFSLEMPAQLLVKRMLAHVSECSLSAMDSVGGLSGPGTGKLYEAYRRLMSANLYIDDYSMNTPVDVLSKCRRLKRDQGLDLIIIDYLQLMTAGGTGRSSESRQVEVSEMSRSMKVYAKELGVPVLLLSQMSRGVDQRTDHVPKLSDLRESGAIEQDADVVMFLHKESQYNPAIPEDLVKLIIRKNRNGPVGDVDLQWNGETTTFRECVGSDYRAEHKEAPRPEYHTAENKAEEGEDEDFAEDVTETDNGLMPFGQAAGADDVPFDLAPSDDAFTEEEEKLEDEEYAEEYSSEPVPPPEDDDDEMWKRKATCRSDRSLMTNAAYDTAHPRRVFLCHARRIRGCRSRNIRKTSLLYTYFCLLNRCFCALYNRPRGRIS